MIRDDAALSRLLARLAAARVVALDTEFHTERHFHPRLMLVQLRVDDDAPVLVDGLAPVDWPALCAALSPVPLLVHGGQSDVAILHRLGGFRPTQIFDTQIAAGCAGEGYPARLQDLLRRVLQIQVPKSETLSDWSRRPLTPDQLRYAEDDVLHLAGLAEALRERLEARGNTAVARACTAEIYGAVLTPPDPAEAWRTVMGEHLLDDQERAVLRALAAWRETRARDLDVPRPQLATDAVLLDLARRQPTTVEALRNNRRLPSHLWKREHEALLASIANARASGPLASTTRGPRAWVEAVRMAARVAEATTGVAAELTIGPRQLERLAGGHPLETWRVDALGAQFSAFLEGRAAVALPGVFISTDYNL